MISSVWPRLPNILLNPAMMTLKYLSNDLLNAAKAPSYSPCNSVMTTLKQCVKLKHISTPLAFCK